MNIPDNLRLKRDGTLYCKDGTPLQEYLAKACKGWKGGRKELPVNIISKAELTRLEHDAFCFRHMGA